MRLGSFAFGSGVAPAASACAAASVVAFLVASVAASAAMTGCSPAPTDGAGSGASGAPAASGAPTALLESHFSDLHARGLFDGAVVVRVRGRLVFERGFGFADVARRLPFTPDTPSDGASLAKTFTAALLVGLQEEKRLDLDASARRLLPELPYPDVTLRHFLSHTSGLPVPDYDFFDPFLPRGEPRTTTRLLQVLAERKPPLAAPSGTTFEYSSFGFDLAALAAERAAGKPYAALLDERFFMPLGITTAFVRPALFSEFPGVRTRAYRRVGGRLEPNDGFDGEGFHGGSNIYISARDLDRWNSAFMGVSTGTSAGVSAISGGGAAPSPLVIGKGALEDLLRPARVGGAATGAADAGTTGVNGARGGGASSGLTLGSWYHDASGSAHWYSGHLQGFHSELFRDRSEGWSVVYVSNNSIEPWLQKGIVRAVTTVLAGRQSAGPGTATGGIGPVGLAAPAISELPAGDRSLLAGRWRLGPREHLDIESTDVRLDMVRDGVRYRVVPIGPRWFYVPGLDFILGMARGGDGALPRLYVSSNLVGLWCERVEGAKKKP